LSLSVVQAQEIAAQEEWFETAKLAQRLEARHLRNALRSKQQNGNIIRNGKKVRGGSRAPAAAVAAVTGRRSTYTNDDLEDKEYEPIVLEKLVKGYPQGSEIELRANFYKSFEADKLAEAPANLRVIKEVTKKPSAEENLRFERETK